MNDVIPPSACAGTPADRPSAPVLTIEELTAERDAALEEVRKLRAAVNRWQMVVQTVLGNIQKVAGEIQVYLRDGVLPE